MHHVKLKHGLINRLQRQQWNNCLNIIFSAAGADRAAGAAGQGAK
jgi:hypothetical protein